MVLDFYGCYYPSIVTEYCIYYLYKEYIVLYSKYSYYIQFIYHIETVNSDCVNYKFTSCKFCANYYCVIFT